MLSRARSLGLVVMLSGALAVIAAPSASAFPVVGLNIANVPTDAQIATAQSLGAKNVRMFLLWADVEPVKGRLSPPLIARYVQVVAELTADGINTDFVVVRTPSWESGSRDAAAAPSNPADYANFLSQLAATPGLAGNHIAYELWNEEDAPEWWSPAPNDNAYAALVKAAAPAIKAADPSATVVLGPTVANDYEFIGSLYGDGIGGLTDAVAVHTDNACLTVGPDASYTENGGKIGRYAFTGYRTVHDTMVAHGEGSHPIWMTEFGWNSSQTASGGSSCPSGDKPSGVSADQQAQYITQAFHCMAGDPYLQVANWFTLDDDPVQQDFQAHYGLETAGGTQKPDFASFSALAHNGDQLTGKCGDFDGPNITISTPKLGDTYATDLPLMASASDGQGVTRLSFYADGSSSAIQNFANPGNGTSVGLTWHGAASLSIGLHTINVQAVDKSGNVGTASVQVKKVSLTQILAVGPVTITLKKLSCSNGVCSLNGNGQTPAGAALPAGKVQVIWQQFKKVKIKKKKVFRYRTLHKGLRNANKPFTFHQRLKPGKWRVQVAFLPPKPLRPGASPWKYFTVKKAKKKHH
jgi:Bacterial Ig domain/Cellulase (glycosyl hydrolase family 5)